MDEIQILQDGNPASQGGPNHHVTSWSLSQLEGKGQKSGRGIETAGRPLPLLALGSKMCIYHSLAVFIQPWINLSVGTQGWGVSCKEHLGRTAGAGAPGRGSSSPSGLLNLPECKTAWKISSFSQFLLFSQEQPPQDSEKAEQSTGYSPAPVLGFITSRCFCTRGSHWSWKGGGKAKAVAKFPPPPHTGVQGRDGGAF